VEDGPAQTTKSTNAVSPTRDKGKGAQTLADATSNHPVNGEKLESPPQSPRAEMSGSGSEGDEPIHSPLALRARMNSVSTAPRAGAETMSLLLVDDNVSIPNRPKLTHCWRVRLLTTHLNRPSTSASSKSSPKEPATPTARHRTARKPSRSTKNPRNKNAPFLLRKTIAAETQQLMDPPALNPPPRTTTTSRNPKSFSST
jgi:hypothetical protein